MKVKHVQICFPGEMRLGYKLRIAASFIWVSSGTPNIPNAVVQVITSGHMPNGFLGVESSRPSRLSSQIVGAGIVVPQDDIVLESQRAVRATRIPAIYIECRGRIGNDRIVGKKGCSPLPEVERDRVIGAAEIA
jgi:hypothetical protein